MILCGTLIDSMIELTDGPTAYEVELIGLAVDDQVRKHEEAMKR